MKLFSGVSKFGKRLFRGARSTARKGAGVFTGGLSRLKSGAVGASKKAGSLFRKGFSALKPSAILARQKRVFDGATKYLGGATSSIIDGIGNITRPLFRSSGRLVGGTIKAGFGGVPRSVKIAGGVVLVTAAVVGGTALVKTKAYRHIPVVGPYLG